MGRFKPALPWSRDQGADAAWLVLHNTPQLGRLARRRRFLSAFFFRFSLQICLRLRAPQVIAPQQPVSQPCRRYSHSQALSALYFT